MLQIVRLFILIFSPVTDYRVSAAWIGPYAHPRHVQPKMWRPPFSIPSRSTRHRLVSKSRYRWISTCAKWRGNPFYQKRLSPPGKDMFVQIVPIYIVKRVN